MSNNEQPTTVERIERIRNTLAKYEAMVTASFVFTTSEMRLVLDAFDKLAKLEANRQRDLAHLDSTPESVTDAAFSSQRSWWTVAEYPEQRVIVPKLIEEVADAAYLATRKHLVGHDDPAQIIRQVIENTEVEYIVTQDQCDQLVAELVAAFEPDGSEETRHLIRITESDWTIQHPKYEREQGLLLDCGATALAKQHLLGPLPNGLGDYWIDADGLTPVEGSEQ